MKTGIDPLVDCAFKKLFGSDSHKNLLLDIVNAVLARGGEPNVVELSILNPYNPKTFLTDKLSVVDIKAKSESGEWFIIEVQVQMSAHFPRRLLYYWARKYQDQLRQGQDYEKLKKVTLICVSKYPLPVAAPGCVSHYLLLESREHQPLCEDLSIYTLAVERFVDLEEHGDDLDRWLYFLKHAPDLDDADLPPQLMVPAIRQAMEVLKMFTQDELERELYESRLKAQLDEASLLADHYRRGQKEGIEIGTQKGIEIGKQKGIEIGRKKEQEMVRNMLKEGMTPEIIAKITGWDLKDIENEQKTQGQ